MMRKKLIERYEDKIRTAQKGIGILQNVPLDKLIRIYSKSWDTKIINGKKKWVKENNEVFGVVRDFKNTESLKIDLIAVKMKGYPFPNPKERSSIALKIAYIQSWKLLPMKDLPLAVGWDNVYEGIGKGLKK